MQISVTGSRQAQRGLTLVEILVVIAILGLFTGLVVLALPQETDRTEKEARNLASQLKVAQELSVMRRQIIGLDIAADGYRFVSYADGEWQEMILPGSKKRRPDTEQDISYEVEFADFVVPGTAGGERDNFSENLEDDQIIQIVPKVIFQPTGEVIPLKIRLVGDDEVWSVRQTIESMILVRKEDV